MNYDVGTRLMALHAQYMRQNVHPAVHPRVTADACQASSRPEATDNVSPVGRKISLAKRIGYVCGSYLK